MAFSTLGATALARSQTKVLIKLVDLVHEGMYTTAFLYRETIFTYSLGNAIYIFVFLSTTLCKNLLVAP